MTRGIKALALAMLWLVPLITLSRALTSDWVSVWQKFYFPVYWGPFMDLQTITSGVKTQQMGGDPILSNPADRSHRVLPYPKIWLHLFSWMGINDANVSIVGVTFCICYLICVSWLILGCSSAFGAVVLLAAGLSLAPLFAIERGNIDLFIFSLVFFGCAATNRFLKSGAYFAAAALKIYPIAALMVDVIRRPLKASTVSIAAALSAFALFAWQWHDLKAIRRAVPADPYFSFGSPILRMHASHMSWRILACSCIAAALIAGAAWLMRPNLDESVLNARWWELFLVFGGIYVFTFAVSSNFNYRLIFLLPTLPLAIEMVRTGLHERWGIVYIIAVVVAENTFARKMYPGLLLDDMATFAVFAMILVVLLKKTKSFLPSVVDLVQSPASVAASPDQGVD
jgi:hypothetical protein